MDQDILGLLPQEVQTKIINRLKAEQKTRVTEDGGLARAKRPKDEILRRIVEDQERQDRQNAFK